MTKPMVTENIYTTMEHNISGIGKTINSMVKAKKHGQV